jgi:hypothetical protein
VPKLAAELGGTRRTAAGVAGSTDRQTACFGTAGEDSVLVKRFIALPR